MAIGVIDPLEAIHIQIQQRRRGAIALAEGHRAPQSLHKAPPVERRGQHVMIRCRLGRLGPLRQGYRLFLKRTDLDAQAFQFGQQLGISGLGHGCGSSPGSATHARHILPQTNVQSCGCNAGTVSARFLRTRHRPMATETTPAVAIIMGSRSDWPTMKHAADALDRLGVAWQAQVVSAHRTPHRLYDFATSAQDEGFQIIIAGAGGAAHLPGMVASLTNLPVLGVPVQSKALDGMDSLLSIVQMPGGVPVATLAIGEAGAKNAGILAAQILALADETLAGRLAAFREAQTESVHETVED